MRETKNQAADESGPRNKAPRHPRRNERQEGLSRNVSTCPRRETVSQARNIKQIIKFYLPIFHSFIPLNEFLADEDEGNERTGKQPS